VSTVNVPKEMDVRGIRRRLKMTQTEFALRFDFSVCTIRNWEQGRRYPSGSDRVFLTLISKRPRDSSETVNGRLNGDRLPEVLSHVTGA